MIWIENWKCEALQNDPLIIKKMKKIRKFYNLNKEKIIKFILLSFLFIITYLMFPELYASKFFIIISTFSSIAFYANFTFFKEKIDYDKIFEDKQKKDKDNADNERRASF